MNNGTPFIVEQFFNLSGIFSIFLLIVLIMALFVPFWILRIRNETIKMNDKLSKLVEMTEHQKGGLETLGQDELSLKYCHTCGKKNRASDGACIQCGELLI